MKQHDPVENFSLFLHKLLGLCNISEDNLKRLLEEFRLKLPENIIQKVERKIVEIKGEVKERSYRKISFKKGPEEKKPNENQRLIFQKRKNLLLFHQTNI